MSNLDIPRSPVANTVMAIALANAVSKEHGTETIPFANERERDVALFSRPASFNPAEYIDNIMQEPTLKNRLMSSLTWRLDNKVIGLCMRIYNDLAGELAEDNPSMSLIDQIDAVAHAVRGRRSLETYWGEGDASKLANMVALQAEWHQMADRMAITAGVPVQPYSREYDFDQRILNADVGDVRALSLANFKAIAKEEADSVPESQRQAVFDETLAQLKHNSSRRVKELLDKRKLRIAALRAIYVEALRAGEDSACGYDQLAAPVKLDFTVQLRNKATAVRGQLADSMETIAFMVVMREARELVNTLTRVADKLAREIQAEGGFSV